MTQTVFLSPFSLFVTIGNDLYGTRSKNYQLKNLSARMAGKEGHTADPVCEALFGLTLCMRFRKRRE